MLLIIRGCAFIIPSEAHRDRCWFSTANRFCFVAMLGAAQTFGTSLGLSGLPPANKQAAATQHSKLNLVSVVGLVWLGLNDPLGLCVTLPDNKSKSMAVEVSA